jgi:hypothetical protein
MYRVRRWNHGRDEMTEKFVNVLDGISMDGYVSGYLGRRAPLSWRRELWSKSHSIADFASAIPPPEG